MNVKRFYPYLLTILILCCFGGSLVLHVHAQSAANFLPPPSPDFLGSNLTVGRITVPLSYQLFVDKYYLFTQMGIDGMTAATGAKFAAQAEAMERISAMLDDYQANDPAAFAQSSAVHNVGPLAPWPGF